MLRLENLRKNGNRITTEFYIPGNEARGSVVFDAHNKKVIEAHCDDRDYDSIYGTQHIEKILGMMVEHNKYPQTYEYYWY